MDLTGLAVTRGTLGAGFEVTAVERETTHEPALPNKLGDGCDYHLCL